MLTTTTTTSNLSADDIEMSCIPDIQLNSSSLAPDISCDTLTTIESQGADIEEDFERPYSPPGDSPAGPQPPLVVEGLPTRRTSTNGLGFKTSFKRRLKWPCGMTNFHFSLCIGVMGFAIFWLLLLLRIYLPEEYFQ